MKRRLLFIFVIILASALLSGCASSNRKVTRIAADSTTDLSGRWNDTDSRLVAEEMIKDVTSRPWLPDYVESHNGQKPVVIVGTVRNKSSEHIATQTFVNDLERELINSGRVKFVQNSMDRSEIRSEREDQQSQASEATAKKLANETGADFMLQGSINSITDAVEGRKVVYYQVDLQLINIESNEKVWIGSKKIKKDIEQASHSW